MTQYARYNVVVDRQLGDDDYIEGHGGNGQQAVIQLAKELQEAWDAGGVAGHFQITCRTVVDYGTHLPVEKLGVEFAEDDPIDVPKCRSCIDNGWDRCAVVLAPTEPVCFGHISDWWGLEGEDTPPDQRVPFNPINRTARALQAAKLVTAVINIDSSAVRHRTLHALRDTLTDLIGRDVGRTDMTEPA